MIMRMPFGKLLYGLMFYNIHLLLKILTTALQYMFDLCHRDHREEFGKKEITGKKQSKCSHVKSYLPNRWPVIRTPCRWQVITIHRGNNDHKTFEPHPDIYQDTHEERYPVSYTHLRAHETP